MPAEIHPWRALEERLAKKRLLPGAGHCPPAEAPELVAEVIDEILSYSLPGAPFRRALSASLGE
jgi:pimeloyl-ACP methyl ester carboxylesterase